MSGPLGSEGRPDLGDGLRARSRWFAGTLSAWGAAWLLLGLRALPSLWSSPQPFVPGARLSGVILVAVLRWAGGALIVYLAAGLALSFVLQLTLTALAGEREISPRFGAGFAIGLAGLLWFHGVLYLQVPGALGTLPLLASLPIGISLLLLFAGAALAAGAAFPGRGLRTQPLRILAVLLVAGAPVLLPHDIFRRSLPRSTPLDPAARRLLVFAIDGLRRDTLEELRPDWAAPAGATAVSSSPSTRRSWLLLYGVAPERAMNSLVMPLRADLGHPEWLTLLVEAGRSGLRTGFVINDSLTPSFGLQDTLFNEVVEPDGGWKYWFTLNYGTIWPAFSWAQNYLSPVETTNPWNDSQAFLRDVGRALRGNHWVSAHDCRTHQPLVQTRGELQAIDPWRWLIHPAWAYQAYESPLEFPQDPARATWRADAAVHYRARVARLVGDLAPYLERWVAEYPGLSGVFTADHGELFVALYGPDKRELVHIAGTHGFNANAPTLLIPLHPFGKTGSGLRSDDVYSWFDLRDDIVRWIRGDEPLRLTGKPDGWLIDFPAIDLRDFYQVSTPSASTGGAADRGIRVGEIANRTFLLPNGAWFIEDRAMDEFAGRKKSSALVTSRGIVMFTPEENDRYSRIRYRGITVEESTKVTREAMAAEIAAFGGSRPAPVSGLETPPPPGAAPPAPPLPLPLPLR